MDNALALVLHDGDALVPLSRWATMDASERRRKATEACRDRDVEVLWSLCEARLLLFGRSGARLSLHTLGAYRTGVTRLLRAWAGVDLLHATPNQGALYVREMEAAGLKPSSVSVRLAGARALYAALRWACTTEQHDCYVDPFKDVHPATDTTPSWQKRKPYTDGDVERLCAVASPEDRVMLLLGANAGLRNAEIVGLTWSDIDLSARYLTVQRGKGLKRRQVPISRSLLSALSERPRQNDYVIASYRTTEQARRRMRALCSRAGVDYKAIHSLRHTAGVRIYRQTGRLEDAQSLLGHSDISTTVTYAKWSDEATQNALADW
jgi:integrase